MAGGSQTPQDLAGQMIPGVPFINWLNHLGSGMNSQVDPQQQAKQDEVLRRQRMGYTINQRRAAAGLDPLADHHLENAIDAQFALEQRQTATNMAATRRGQYLGAQPAQPQNALRARLP